MKTNDICTVSIDRTELHDLISNAALESLEKTIPGIDTLIDLEYTCVEIIEGSEKYQEEDKFHVDFECRINLLEILKCSGEIVCKLTYPENTVIEMIVDQVLKERKNERTANMNTPAKDIKFAPGSHTGNEEAISFSFSITFDDPSDHQ